MKTANLCLCTILLLNISVAMAFGSAGQPKKSLSEIEAKIAETVKSHSQRALTTLETVVNINSGTMNFAGVKKVAQVLTPQLEAMNFEVLWLPGSSFDRAGHLVATRHATKPSSPKVLMIGHLDTVFSKDDSFQTFERIDDSHIAGPGITDMKGGDVIIVEALSALNELGLLDNLSIKIVMTGDEEASGKPLSASKKALTDAADWADIALGFEDGDSDIKTAVIARRGSVNWQLDVSGKPAHSSQIFQPDVGYGAVFEIARILNEFREKLAGKGDLTFNPGLIIGGTSIDHQSTMSKGEAFGKNNVIAKTAKVSGGIRALSAEELRNAKSVMQKIVADNLLHTKASLQFEEGYPPMAPTAGNRTLLKMYSDVSESLGYNTVVAVNPRNAGAADISFTAGRVEMGLDGLGLMGRGGHTKDEVADISSLLKNTQKAALLLYRISKRQSQY